MSSLSVIEMTISWKDRKQLSIEKTVHVMGTVLPFPTAWWNFRQSSSCLQALDFLFLIEHFLQKLTSANSSSAPWYVNLCFLPVLQPKDVFLKVQRVILLLFFILMYSWFIILYISYNMWFNIFIDYLPFKFIKK